MKTSFSFLSLAALAALSLSACHHHSSEAAGPLVLDGSKAHDPWVTVSLTLAGSGADHGKADDCKEEAKNAGIGLAPGAAISGTIYFLDQDDYLESAAVHGGRYPFSAMGSSSECKLGLAKLVNIDDIVQTSKSDPPANCKNIGTVEGSDKGWLMPGNYDAAVAEVQFKVHALGGNYVALDVVRQMGASVFVNGHGYACPK